MTFFTVLPRMVWEEKAEMLGEDEEGREEGRRMLRGGKERRSQWGKGWGKQGRRVEGKGWGKQRRRGRGKGWGKPGRCGRGKGWGKQGRSGIGNDWGKSGKEASSLTTDGRHRLSWEYWGLFNCSSIRDVWMWRLWRVSWRVYDNVEDWML